MNGHFILPPWRANLSQYERPELGEDGGRLGARVVSALRAASFKAPCSLSRGVALRLLTLEYPELNSEPDPTPPIEAEAAAPKPLPKRIKIERPPYRLLTTEERERLYAMGSAPAIAKAAGLHRGRVANALHQGGRHRSFTNLYLYEIEALLQLTPKAVATHETAWGKHAIQRRQARNQTKAEAKR